MSCLELECEDSTLYDVIGREFGYRWLCQSTGDSLMNFIDWGEFQLLERRVNGAQVGMHLLEMDNCFRLSHSENSTQEASRYFQSLERMMLHEKDGIQTWRFWPVTDSLSFWLVEIQLSDHYTWPLFSFLQGTPIRIEGKRGAVDFSFFSPEICKIERLDIGDCTEEPIDSLRLFPPRIFVSDDLEVSGNVIATSKQERQPIAGAAIEIFQSGELLTVINANDSGHFVANLPLDYLYLLHFNAEGKVHKSIEIDTRFISLSDQSGGFAIDINVSLFPEIPGVDFSILNQPIGKCKFEAQSGSLEFDFEYTRLINDSINELFNLKTH